MSFSPLLAFHISAGSVAILSGAAAMSFRQGSPRHALAGKVFVISMLYGRHRSLPGGDETPNGQCSWRRLHVLSGGDGMGDRQAQKRRDEDLRLACAYTSSGGPDCTLDFWCTSGASPDVVRKRSPRWDELFHGLCAAACCRRGRSYDGTGRPLQRTAYHAASLHMCFALFIATGLSSWDRATSISAFNRTIKRTFCPGAPATAIADFLAIPSSLQKCIPEETDNAWR